MEKPTLLKKIHEIMSNHWSAGELTDEQELWGHLAHPPAGQECPLLILFSIFSSPRKGLSDTVESFQLQLFCCIYSAGAILNGKMIFSKLKAIFVIKRLTLR